MKTVNNLTQIIKMARNRKLYVRWSSGPARDIKRGFSINHANGTRESGLSAQPIRSDNPQLLARMLVEYCFVGGFCWIFEGRQNGIDADGAPTVDASSVVPLAKVSPQLIDKCLEFSLAYGHYDEHYAWNAQTPEHFERNRQLDEAFERTWGKIAPDDDDADEP